MKFASDKFESEIYRNAANAVRGKIVSGGVGYDGHFNITLNGKISPSVQYMQNSYGVKETWRFLTSDCGAPRSAVTEKLVTNIDYQEKS